MHDFPYLTCLCIAPGTEKELSVLVTEFFRQDHAAEQRELVIIDDGPVNQQAVLTELLPSFGPEISVCYHHSPQPLFPEEKVRLGAELARGDWFHFITVNTHYPDDYFRHAVQQAHSSTEKIAGTAQETLWLSPLKRFCLRKTHLAWYSALNALCCHRSVVENDTFLLSADGWEASLTGSFVEITEMTPVTYCHDIMAIVRNGQLLNTIPINHSPPESLLSEFQPEKTIDWDFFHRIACISLNEGTARARSFHEQLETLRVPEKKTLWFPVYKGHSPVAGRMQAWLEILRTARDNSWGNVLILEDDIQFVRQESMVEKINALLASLARRPWKAVLFSAQYQDVSLLMEIKDVVTVSNAAAIGSCAVHGSYFAVLIAFFEELLNRLMSEQNSQEIQPDHFWHILMKNDSWLGLWPSWGFQAAEFNDVRNTVTDSVPLFFRPLLALDSDMRSRIEGPLLERVKYFQATPQVYAALAQFNHEMQRYELRNYYQFKASGRFPPVRKDESWPLLSVLIPAYNQVENLKEALESVFLQSYPNMEIVVADDCSTDGTQDYIEGITDPRLRYVRNTANLGACNNISTVFKNHVHGKYVIFLNHDDLFVISHYLWDAVQVMENDNNLSVVFSNYYEWHETNYSVTKSSDSHQGPNVSKINGQHYFLEYNTPELRYLHPVVTVCRRQHAIQAQAMEFSENTKVGDMHIFMRTMLFGDVAFIPVFSASYRIHEKSQTFNLSDNGDIRPDIAFMRDMEKTRTIALQQGLIETSVQSWFKRTTLVFFLTYRFPVIFNQNKYSCVLSLLAWMNKYYPETGHDMLRHLLVRK